MEVSDYTLHDKDQDRDFDLLVYGSAGRPVIVLPSWDFTCTNWENNGMVDALAEHIGAGEIQLFCPDSADASGWYARSLDLSYRYGHVASYLTFVEEVLLPFVTRTAVSTKAPLLAGAGIGALNATLLMLRHPERYGGLLALSGTYDARELVGELDEQWTALSPIDLVSTLPTRGKVVRTLRSLPIAFVCGQGDDETGINDQRALDAVFAEKKVGATFEYWGYDVGPDWVWWQEEVRQLLPCLLTADGLADRGLMRRVSVAEVEVDHAADILERCETDLAAVRERLDAARAELAAANERYEREQEVVAAHVDEAERLAVVAREAWTERERAARLLGEAQAKGDTAQAAADAAAGDLSVAEWICGEAKADADAAAARESELARLAEEAGEAVRRATAEHRRTAEELASVNAAIEAERAGVGTKRKPASRKRR